MASQLFPSAAVAAAAALLVAFAAPACSSNNATSAPACDDTKCLPGNKCLTLDGELKCRKTCSSNTDPATSCPFGYTCVSQDPEPFCVQDNTSLTNTKAQNGQFGFTCDPTKGIDKNSDCDTAQNFWCFGDAPTDANAYCTRYGCTDDRDCAAGYFCGAVNVSPNVHSPVRDQKHETQKVCQKREYCAPCTADLDCPPLAGKPQRCVPDATTNVFFCTPHCGSNDECNGEARCAPYPKDDGTPDNVCYPRAGVCVGDGSVCAPCRSDDDCLQPGEQPGEGECIHGQYYATEKFCAKKSKTPCDTMGGGATCPAEYGPAKKTQAKVYCLGGNSGFAPQVDPNYCHGLLPFGSAVDIGCFSAVKQ
jgi:hypothetical protein